MTRRLRAGSSLHRALLGVTAVGIAIAGLYAPAAQASPESDAAGAITAAWDAAGGEGSTLGPRDGDVYAVGQGFGQNFAGGAIFFTPDTGAKIMGGAILDKYRALGGPADSGLGFPNIDEGAGKAEGSRNSTFSAGDHPVIFWTPDHGAWVVRGAVNAAWDKLGGSAGVLGVPIADESYAGDVISQKFTGGQVSYDIKAKTFTSEPPELSRELAGLAVPVDPAAAIATAWRMHGGSAGALGAKAGNQYAIGNNGAGQDFAGGKVFFSPDTGAFAVTGEILKQYDSAGGPAGTLGFPASGETDGGVPDSRMQGFSAADHPVIFWSKDHGAIIVGGAMKTAWDKLGGPTGALGIPVKAQNTDGSAVTQEFSGGTITWDGSKNTFTTDPGELAESLRGIEVTAAPVPSAPPTAPAPATDSALKWHTWWLWWIIPLALLLLGSLYAWVAMRRRRAASGEYDEYDDEDYDDEDYEDSGYGARFDREFDGYGREFQRERPESGPDAGREDAGFGSGPGRSVLAGSGWSGRDVPSSPLADPDDNDALFTHRGAHEAPGVEPDEAVSPSADRPDENPDVVDTAPTKVIGRDEHSGRHSVPAADAPTWSGPSDESYTGPGALFEPVHESGPPQPGLFEVPDAPQQAGPYEETTVGYPRSGWSDYEAAGQAAHRDPEPRGSEPPAPPEEVRDEPQADAVAPPAIHLPLDDPHQAPEGYLIKGSMRTGKYHAPGTPGYDEMVAEIWFASTELAEANGFGPAD